MMGNAGGASWLAGLVLQQLQKLVLLVAVVLAVVAVVAEAAASETSSAAANDYEGSNEGGSSISTAAGATTSTSGPIRTSYLVGYDPSDPSLTDTCGGDGNGGRMMLGDMLCYSWPNILYVVLLVVSLVMYVATGVFHDLANAFRD
jgi:hypothetical protein